MTIKFLLGAGLLALLIFIRQQVRRFIERRRDAATVDAPGLDHRRSRPFQARSVEEMEPLAELRLRSGRP